MPIRKCHNLVHYLLFHNIHLSHTDNRPKWKEVRGAYRCSCGSEKSIKSFLHRRLHQRTFRADCQENADRNCAVSTVYCHLTLENGPAFKLKMQWFSFFYIRNDDQTKTLVLKSIVYNMSLYQYWVINMFTCR